jgi:hypothetical protein
LLQGQGWPEVSLRYTSGYAHLAPCGAGGVRASTQSSEEPEFSCEKNVKGNDVKKTECKVCDAQGASIFYDGLTSRYSNLLSKSLQMLFRRFGF